jgi:hypothetical protein
MAQVRSWAALAAGSRGEAFTFNPNTPSFTPAPCQAQAKQAPPRHGQFCMLNLSLLSPSSIFHSQPHVDPRVDRHPVCVVGTRDNGKIACVLPVTSFQDTTIERKFPGTTNLLRFQYVPIDHHRATKSHDELPILHLEKGDMAKQSYVHLDQWIEIEVEFLEAFYRGTKCLDLESTNNLQALFRGFISGLIDRPSRGRGGRLSPTDYYNRIYTPESLGVPAGLATEIRAPSPSGQRRKGSGRRTPTPPPQAYPIPNYWYAANTPTYTNPWASTNWRTGNLVTAAA